MKNKTIWIVLAVIVVLAIVFFVWRSNQAKKLVAQSQQQQFNNLLYGPGGVQVNRPGGSGMIDSIGGLIDSASGLFGQFGWGKDNQSSDLSGNGIDQLAINQFANQCEMIYNTQAEVDQCVQAKINAAT